MPQKRVHVFKMNDTLNVRFDVWKLHFTRGSHNLNDYPKSFRILMKFRFLECEFDEIRHSPHGFSEQEKKNYCNGNLGYNCSHKNSHFFSLSLFREICDSYENFPHFLFIFGCFPTDTSFWTMKHAYHQPVVGN